MSLSAQSVWAETPVSKIQGFLVNADSMERDTVNDTVVLIGHVQVVYNSQHIKCNRAKIQIKTKIIYAEGNVEITSDKSTIGGDRISFDLDNNSGVIYNGWVTYGNVFFQGEELRKISDDEYYIKEGNYTSCVNCSATWSFYGSGMRADLGSYAYIKNSVLRFGTLPVIWLPYLVVPLKSDRQSGLLTPSVEVSAQLGFGIEQPFFWAISRNTDATITFKYYEFGGVKTLLNYRYRLTDTSFGELNSALFDDRSFRNTERLNRFRSQVNQGNSINRYFVKYRHYYEMPDNITQRTELNWASDLQYPKDFPLETRNHGDSAMENRISVTKNTEDQHTSLEAAYYINLLHADPLSGNDDAVHRLPEFQFSQAQKEIGSTGFLYNFDLNYVNFARAGKGYDNLTGKVKTPDGQHTLRYLESENCISPIYAPDWYNDNTCVPKEDGKYDPNKDLIRTGQRLDFRPTLYRSINLGDFYLLPSIGFQETHYNFNVPENPSSVRRLINTEIKAGTYYSRVFGDLSPGSKNTRYKHEIKPEISYRKVPWIDHHSHPFFGFTNQTDAPYFLQTNITDDDLGSDYGLQFDYRDRVFGRELVTMSITNNLVEKSWSDNNPDYRQIVSLLLSQSYDVFQANQNQKNKEPWSSLLGRLTVRYQNFDAATTVYYLPYHNVVNSSSRIRYNRTEGNFYQLGVTRQYQNPLPGEKLDLSSLTSEFTFTTGLNFRYLNLIGRMALNNLFVPDTSKKVAVTSWLYVLQFKPPGDCFIFNFANGQGVDGNPFYKVDFNFNFDGNPKNPISEEIIGKYF